VQVTRRNYWKLKLSTRTRNERRGGGRGERRGGGAIRTCTLSGSCASLMSLKKMMSTDSSHMGGFRGGAYYDSNLHSALALIGCHTLHPLGCNSVPLHGPLLTVTYGPFPRLDLEEHT